MDRYATFVVRIRLDARNTILGGHISHVSSQKTAHFRDLRKALAFIQESLGGAVAHQYEGKLNGPSIDLEGDVGDHGRS